MKIRLVHIGLLVLLLTASGKCPRTAAQTIPTPFHSNQPPARVPNPDGDLRFVGPLEHQKDAANPGEIHIDGQPTAAQDGTAATYDFDQLKPINVETPKSAEKIKSFWDNVEINGHIRVRQETDWERINQPTRNRGRLRARLALTWNPDEEFKAGFRWTTGDRKIVLEPGDRRGAALSYQDMGDVFDKFELNLDRIFITYEPDWLPESFVTFGKFKFPGKLNPIFTDPIGDLVFDEAIQPEGIAGGCSWAPKYLFDEINFTAGATIVLEQGRADESSMVFTQLWATRHRNNMTLEGGVTWFDWNNLNADGSTRISFENNFGNEVVQVGPNPEDVVFASGFNVIQPMLVVTFDDRDPCDRIHPVQFIWETFHNFESFDDSRDSGYSLGFQYGSAVKKTGRKRGDWKFYYTWNKVEQESVLTPVAQDDWQRATNFRGHWFGADYYVRNNIELRLWILGDRPILPINSQSQIDLVNGSRQQEWRGRIDLTVYY